MNMSLISKIKSMLGLNPKLVSSDDANSLNKVFQQSECKCEQTTFGFMNNTYLPKEKVITPLIFNTIDIVKKEKVKPYSLKPELPVTQNRNGQLNILFEPCVPSIQEVVFLAEKENLESGLGQPFIDICEYEIVEDVNLDTTPSNSNSYTINYFVKNNNALIMKNLKIIKK